MPSHKNSGVVVVAGLGWSGMSKYEIQNKICALKC